MITNTRPRDTTKLQLARWRKKGSVPIHCSFSGDGIRSVVLAKFVCCCNMHCIHWIFHRSEFRFHVDACCLGLSFSTKSFLLTVDLVQPFFPNAITLGTKFLPKRLHMGAITIFACFGSVGNALFPFATGMLASIYGIWVLQPIVVSLMAGMAVAWSLLPRVDQRRD
jgi:fucose permease